MTIIAVNRLNKNKFVMVGDRGLTTGNGHRTIDVAPKINKVGNTLIGGAGNATPLSLIMGMSELSQLDFVPNVFNYLYFKLIPKLTKSLNLHELKEAYRDEDGEKVICELLICTQNKVFEILILTKGIELLEVATPTGCGCGWANAFGALTAINQLVSDNTAKGIEKKLIMAAATAGTINIYCDDNIDVLTGGGIVYDT